MGTDIHVYIEKLDKYGEPPRWELVATEDFTWHTRNYDVFAILADVRNGRGFAGCDTGDGFVPIAPPKGFPEDASPDLRRHFEERGEHTPSWLLLSEIYDYDWSRATVHRGWVEAPELLWMIRTGAAKPRSWCGGVDGRDVQRLERGVLAAKLLALGDPPPAVIELLSKPDGAWTKDVADFFEPLRRCYARVEWRETYTESVGDFLKWVRSLVPRNEEERRAFWRNERSDFADTRLSYRNPDEVRLVFWFDS